MAEDERELRAVMLHRLGSVESGQKELQGAIKEAVGQLGGQMTALQSQLEAFRQSMPLHYTPRPEAEERVRRFEARFQAIEDQIDGIKAEHTRDVADLKAANTREHADMKKDTDWLRDNMWKGIAAIASALGLAFLAILQSVFRVIPSGGT